MRALMLKEFICQRRWYIAYGLYSIPFYLIALLTREALDISFVVVISSLGIGFMILIGSFKSDRGETHLFLLSLPITRSEIVQSKFLLLILGTLFGLVTSILFGLLFTSPLIGLSLGTVDMIDIIRILTGMMILSPILPFYFAFGHLATRYFLFAFIGIGVALQVFFIIILGISAAGEPNIIDLLIDWFTAIPRLTRNLALFTAALTLFTGTYTASLGIFRRRDL